MGFDKLRVSTRLGIRYGLVSLLLFVVTALGVNRMAHIKDRVDEIIKVNDVEARLAATMDLTVTERALALRNLILLDSNNKKEIQLEIDRVAEQEKKYAQAEQQLSSCSPGWTARLRRKRNCSKRYASRRRWPRRSIRAPCNWRSTGRAARHTNWCVSNSARSRNNGGRRCVSWRPSNKPRTTNNCVWPTRPTATHVR